MVYTYHNFPIHSSADGHLGCFHVLAVVNSAAINIGVHVSFWVMVFSGYMPSCGIAGLFGSFRGVPGGVVVKNPPANARDIRNLVTHSGILVWESQDWGSWRATAHGVAKTQTRLNWFGMHGLHDNFNPTFLRIRSCFFYVFHIQGKLCSVSVGTYGNIVDPLSLSTHPLK